MSQAVANKIKKDKRFFNWAQVPGELFSESCSLGLNEKMVYIVLLYHSNSSDNTFVSNRTIGKESGMSERSVIRATVTLEENYYIIKEPRYEKTKTGKSRQTSNLITVNHPLQSLDFSEPHDTESPMGVTESHTPHDTESPHRVTESHTNNIINNNKNNINNNISKDTDKTETSLSSNNVVAVFGKYNFKLSRSAKAMKELIKLSEQEVEKVARQLREAEDDQDCSVKNAMGLLNSDSLVIIDNILHDSFYNKSKKPKKKKNLYIS